MLRCVFLGCFPVKDEAARSGSRRWYHTAHRLTAWEVKPNKPNYFFTSHACQKKGSTSTELVLVHRSPGIKIRFIGKIL